jgi:hypothetical protein
MYSMTATERNIPSRPWIEGRQAPRGLVAVLLVATAIGFGVYHHNELMDYWLTWSGPMGPAIAAPGLKLDLRGAYVVEAVAGRLHARAFSLQPQLRIDRDSPIGPLRLRLFNVHAEWHAAASRRTRVRNNTLTLNAPAQASSWPIRLRAELPQRYRIVVFGDSRGNLRLLPRMVEEIDRLEPLFVVHLGDIVDGGTAGEYESVRAVFRRFAEPVFTTIGNHDVEHGGRAHYRRWFGPDYYHFIAGDTLYLFLDNANPILFWAGAQARWLAERLAGEHYRRAVVFVHRPPYDPRPGEDHGMGNPIGARRLAAALADPRIAAVFASHVHGYFESRIGSVPLVVTGGAGAPLVPGGFYHYLIVEVAPDELRWEVRRFQAESGGHRQPPAPSAAGG